ncbi:MAG: hypothetical protein SNJ82_14150 [Gemmataceae bacterium]
MNFTDLFTVIGLGSALYAVLVVFTRQQQFLVKAVNPYRLMWVITGFSVFWVGIGLMRLEVGNWNFNDWWPVFFQLISDEPAGPRVKIASLAIFFGILLIGLVVYCVMVYPRDPSTFRGPNCRRSAVRYYVRLRGGLDFAQIRLGDGEIQEEESHPKQIALWCPHLPKVKMGDEVPRIRTVEDQLELWRELARSIHSHMRELDELVSIAHQGHNRRLVFDCEYGAIFFHYLRMPDPAASVDTGIYLFGATLSQTEMNNGQAEQHFQLLYEALKNIDRSIRVD